MPVFTYSANGPSGIVSGELNASDRAEAFTLLGRQRLQPFKLAQSGANVTRASGSGEKTHSTRTNVANGPIRLKLAQVVLFVEELSDLMNSGIQLEPALATMEKRREMSGVKDLATALRVKLRDGMSFSKAVAATSPSFGNLFCALAAAGEASGALPHILKRQADYLRSLASLRSKVAFALIYPSFLIVAAVSVTLLFSVYLIPKLTELLDSTGGTLPLGAQLILKFSEFMKSFWWIIAIAGGIGALLFKAWLARPESAIPWARMKLRIPLFGSIFRARFYVQFLETMSNLVGNGLPMIHALQLTQQATDNPFLQREMGQVIQHVGEGVSLSRALERSGQFPSLLLDMVSVGEQTGKIADALGKAAERFDRELAKTVEKVSALIQPLIICIMAGMVGIMAYLMVTSIFQTMTSISK
jgi:type II secretory pathway component PulF